MKTKTPIIGPNFDTVLRYLYDNKISTREFHMNYFWAKDQYAVRGRRFSRVIQLHGAYLLPDYEEIMQAIEQNTSHHAEELQQVLREQKLLRVRERQEEQGREASNVPSVLQPDSQGKVCGERGLPE